MAHESVLIQLSAAELVPDITHYQLDRATFVFRSQGGAPMLKLWFRRVSTGPADMPWLASPAVGMTIKVEDPDFQSLELAAVKSTDVGTRILTMIEKKICQYLVNKGAVAGTVMVDDDVPNDLP